MSDFVFLRTFFQVTGVVGRAEILSSAFFLAAFIFYTKATRRKKITGEYISDDYIKALHLIHLQTLHS